jgi:hypothetical protein
MRRGARAHAPRPRFWGVTIRLYGPLMTRSTGHFADALPVSPDYQPIICR